MKAVNCYHCGDECGKDQVEFDHKSFCCLGCKTVYEILNQNSLMEFYELNKTPGIKPKSGGGGINLIFSIPLKFLKKSLILMMTARL